MTEGQMTLIDSASTQSRGRRPILDRAMQAVTVETKGARELVEFTMEDGTVELREVLSWVAGQAGLLWGMSPDVYKLFHLDRKQLMVTHGAYGHVLEHEAAEALAKLFAPYIVRGSGGDKGVGVRFFQNGGDACAAAARLCREYSGRQWIATQGYHGAQTDFGHRTANGAFPPGYLRSAVEYHGRFEFGDFTQTYAAAGYAAGLMIEVPGLDDEGQIAEFLKYARHTADVEDIPLVIDDVVGGFRFALRGTCERYNVQADLICLGKALSALGGVAALVGRMDMMELFEGDVFYSTTFGGNPADMAVTLASIEWLEENRDKVYGPRGHLQTVGRALKEGFNALGVPCVGQPERSAFAFETDEEWLRFCRRMLERGVLVHRPNFVTLAHTLADVEETLRITETITESLNH